MAILAATLVVAPGAFGSITHPTILRAPFKGASIGLFDSNSQVSCGKAKIVKGSFYVARTGNGGFADQAFAPSCKVAPGAANYGQSTGEFALLVPVKLSGGTHHIIVNLTVTASRTTSLTSGKCANSTAASYDCLNLAEAFVFAQASLYDASNGTTFASTNARPGFVNLTFNQTVCTMGSCSTSSSGGTGGTATSTATIRLYVNATVKPGQAWSIQVIVFGGALAEVDSFGSHVVGGLASASVNVATLGNGAKINSISVA
jgi:hypothetical protein